jgi:hypothetical protein
MNSNNVLIVYNKQGQINEVPIVFAQSTPLVVQGQALPKEDCIIIGMIFENNMYTNVDNNPLFCNITNIERFLMQHSTNASFIIPANNYRIAGIPILFEYFAEGFFYESTIKPVRGFPEFEFLSYPPKGSGYIFNITYKFPNSDTYTLELYNGSGWQSLQSIDDLTQLPVFNVTLGGDVYLRVVDHQGNATEPYFFQPNNFI